MRVHNKDTFEKSRTSYSVMCIWTKMRNKLISMKAKMLQNARDKYP